MKPTDEELYQAYMKFCLLVGVAPLPLDRWIFMNAVSWHLQEKITDKRADRK